MKKRTNNKKILVRKLTPGGSLDPKMSGNISAGLGAASSGVTAGLNNAQIADTSQLENSINNVRNTTFSATNNDDLLSQWGSIQKLNNVSYDDVRGVSSGQQIGNTAVATLSGAASGFTAGGPIGAIIGAGVGLLGGIGGSIAGSAKAKRKQAELNNAINTANITKASAFDSQVDNVANQNNLNLLANYAAFGGNINTKGGIFSNGITVIGNGGTHEANPMEGVPMGIDSQGIPNLVEEGEVKYNNYIFSNRLKVPKEFKKQYNINGETFADAAKEMQKESEERPNDPISKRGLENSMMLLQNSQEELKMQEMPKQQSMNNKFVGGGPLGWEFNPTFKNPTDPLDINNIDFENLKGFPKIEVPNIKGTDIPLFAPNNYTPQFGAQYSNANTTTSSKQIPGTASWLRYSPAVANGLVALSDAFGLSNQPNYENAERTENSRNQLRDISANPIGNYLTYKPFDRDYYTNKLNAQAGATRRAITNQAGGNRAAAMAGILASDYNAQSKLGELFTQAENYNLGQRAQVEQFNRGTNQFNAQQAMQAASANQNNDRLRMQALMQGAAMREQIRNNAEVTRSANLSNFINSLGDVGIDELGKEQFATAMANSGSYFTDAMLKNMPKNTALSILMQQGWTKEEALKRINQ